nr:hypothetical protein [Photorhabdus hindustanensis]
MDTNLESMRKESPITGKTFPALYPQKDQLIGIVKFIKKMARVYSPPTLEVIMFFSVGVELPKDENTAYGLVIPALYTENYGCFLLLIIKKTLR